MSHSMRGCYCPHCNTRRANQRAWNAAHPGAKREALRRHRDGHRGCYCHTTDCPRVRIEIAIARDPTPSHVMASTGCDYGTYRATLVRMSAAA